MEHIMKTLTHLLPLLLLLPAGMIFAQSPPPDDPFLIGAYAVAPEWNDSNKRIEWVHGVRALPMTAPDTPYDFLSEIQFNRARELGLNLIHTTIIPDSVFIPAPNVVRQICDSAAPAWRGEALRVNVLDPSHVVVSC